MQTLELPKVIGPFRDRNSRGLPIVYKNGFPAWAYKPNQQPPRSRASDRMK